MLKYTHKDMAHLRTKRKPSYRSIGSIVFAIILMFVFMSILITISDFAKQDKPEISYANGYQKSQTNSRASQKGETTWVLDTEGSLRTERGDTIFIQKASTELAREIGLSGRETLKVYEDKGQITTEGMLFAFEREESTTFWMKDMTFDLDILWLDKNYKIVHIESNVRANSYKPDFPTKSKTFTNGKALAQYVLEIKAGLSKKMNLKVGHTLTLE